MRFWVSQEELAGSKGELEKTLGRKVHRKGIFSFGRRPLEFAAYNYVSNNKALTIDEARVQVRRKRNV